MHIRKMNFDLFKNIEYFRSQHGCAIGVIKWNKCPMVNLSNCKELMCLLQPVYTKYLHLPDVLS